MSGLAKLILRLGGKEISHHNLETLTRNAQDEALKFHVATMPTEHVSPGTASSVPDTNAVDKYGDPPHQASKNIAQLLTQPCPMDSTDADLDDDKDNPGLYGKMIDGVSGGTYLITASFIKTNDKIRDQLLKNFGNFSELMCANINGLKIHPISAVNHSLF
jgi:hypothetical protein